MDMCTWWGASCKVVSLQNVVIVPKGCGYPVPECGRGLSVEVVEGAPQVVGGSLDAQGTLVRPSGFRCEARKGIRLHECVSQHLPMMVKSAAYSCGIPCYDCSRASLSLNRAFPRKPSL